MKKQIQQVGVRKWFGDDWISMQDEMFSVLEGFFGNCGQQFILSGCIVNGNDISAGIVGLIDGSGFHLCRFAGIQGVAWPVYLYPSKITENRAYLDNQVKPVSENWTVATSGNNPGGYLQLKQDGTSARFFDAIQTANMRFVTDAEKTAYSAQATAAITTIRGGVVADYDTLAKIVTTLLLLATKDSPTFTGIPAAPTAAPGTNTTQLANTAFVQAAVAALVASSPATLDTLNELATALGNDPNFATTITTALALKAPLANPALSGTPTAPTAAGGTNTTQLATTAFVQAAVAAIFLNAALTGVPTAPTAAPGTNTTQLANTAFVQAAVSALVASSPAALDTLNELATALGNDANFATTMTNALAGKAAKASNLSDLANVATARTNLGLLALATLADISYAQVNAKLKSYTALASGAVDLSAYGGGRRTLTANTAFSFSNFELNKSYMLVVTANGFTPSFATAAKHVPVEGNATLGTAGVFYINLLCIDATGGSEKLLTIIMKGA